MTPLDKRLASLDVRSMVARRKPDEPTPWLCILHVGAYDEGTAENVVARGESFSEALASAVCLAVQLAEGVE